MYEKIDSIARIGKLGFEEYKEYIDEIANNGQVWILHQMLTRKYGIKNTVQLSLVDMKTQRIFDIIRLQTISDFQKDLKRIYDDNSCYQIGKKVYSSTHSFLGELYKQTQIVQTNQTLFEDVLITIKGEDYRTWGPTYSLMDKYKYAIQFIVS